MGALVTLVKGYLTSQASPKKIPTETAVGMVFHGSKVGKSHVDLFRNWSKGSPWVRAAINVRKTQVSSAEWDIVNFDQDVKVDNVRLQKKIKALFDTPNPRADSFRSFVEPVVEDILTLDAGVIEKVPNLLKETVQLWGIDGGTIRVNALWDGDPKEARYYWYPDFKERARWINAEMLYIMGNPSTYSPLGLSPLETLKAVIDAELGAHDYNTRQVINAAPDGMIDLGEGFRPEQVDEFKSYWHAEVAGKGAMAFLGGSKNAKFIPFRGSNREMQFMEWQNYLVRKICAVFQISPQDIGVTFDINRATGEVQAEMTEDRGLRPLLGLLQDHFTREIVWGDEFGGPANNLAFRFTSLNLKETLNKAKINQLAMAGVPWKTPNEARKEEGREPLAGEEYDDLLLNTAQGVVRVKDVPTMREFLEAKKPPARPAPAAKPAATARPK